MSCPAPPICCWHDASGHPAGSPGARSPGDDDPALFEAELRAREARLGPSHPDVAEALSNLAIIYNQVGGGSWRLPGFERLAVGRPAVHAHAVFGGAAVVAANKLGVCGRQAASAGRSHECLLGQPSHLPALNMPAQTRLPLSQCVCSPVSAAGRHGARAAAVRARSGHLGGRLRV